jgi:N-acetylglucosaminylphosphatidylinositol deacetylase
VVYLYQRGRKTKKEHHILFVTAHPDDESMFFGPTIADLTRDYFVHLLCLSQATS